jgi:predicted HTH transcriptional regulator
MTQGPFDTSPEGILELITQGESSLVEFKSRLPPDEVVAEDLISFANKDGGILLVGVGENGELGALRPWEIGEVFERLKRIAGSALPESYVNATKVDQHWIAYVIVPSAPAHLSPLRTAKGEIYDRVGTTTVRRAINQDSPPIPQKPSELCPLFVAMSFRTEEEPSLVDYFEAMRRAVNKAGLPFNIRRIDLVEGDYEISQEIMRQIDESKIVIIDFTLNPSNVYFEAGYARGCRKEIIQTARKETLLEFDVKNWRTIFYRNATELEAALVSALAKAYAEVTVPGNS